MTDGQVNIQPDGLAMMREPFPENQISKLPKPTRWQTDEVKNNIKAGFRCPECGGWHHPKVVHLDYVGHAALTDRLLDCDPEWNWSPCAVREDGTPLLDQHGGMWIELTVCGVTRKGYGHADGKTGGDAIKETIGDALRNAAMRFGAALDLWHKGDLHVAEDSTQDEAPAPTEAPTQQAAQASASNRMTKAVARETFEKMQAGLRNQSSANAINKWLSAFDETLRSLPEDWERQLRLEALQEIDAHDAAATPETEGMPF